MDTKKLNPADAGTWKFIMKNYADQILKPDYGCWDCLLLLLHDEEPVTDLSDLLKLTSIAETIQKSDKDILSYCLKAKV